MNDVIYDSMEQLFAEADSKGLWFFCAYYDLWIPPAILRKAHAAGFFRWGVGNWQLRDPQQYVAEAQHVLVEAEKEPTTAEDSTSIKGEHA